MEFPDNLQIDRKYMTEKLTKSWCDMLSAADPASMKQAEMKQEIIAQRVQDAVDDAADLASSRRKHCMDLRRNHSMVIKKYGA